jgi:hypothetical protein
MGAQEPIWIIRKSLQKPKWNSLPSPFATLKCAFVAFESIVTLVVVGIFEILRFGLGCFGFNGAGKVYFIAGHYDVKLQADTIVRWDVVLRD